VKLTSDLM